VLLGLLFFVALYILFRMLRPEQLVDPDAFPTLVQYLTSLRGAVSPLVPSSWVSEALAPLLRGRPGDVAFFLLMLWSTSATGFIIGEWACGKLYYAGWTRSQEGKKAKLSRSSFADRLFGLAVLPFRGATRAIVLKDLRIFFRDTSQWSQLFLLLALMVVYIYSFRLLPLERSPLPTVFLQNLISFLNLGMVGFVTSAVAVRFVFPAVSLEGESFWIVRSSPLELKSFLWAKFWSSVLPLLLLAEILIVLSNMLLDVSPLMMAVGVVTVFLMTFGITALGVGMGAVFPRFRYENVAQIPTGFGGIVYMLLTMLFIGAVITLEGWPIYRLIMAHTAGARFSSRMVTGIVLPLLAVLALNVLAVVLPIRIGLKRLLAREI
jgi:ABC-2 type transport system permease protein